MIVSEINIVSSSLEFFFRAVSCIDWFVVVAIAFLSYGIITAAQARHLFLKYWSDFFEGGLQHIPFIWRMFGQFLY